MDLWTVNQSCQLVCPSTQNAVTLHSVDINCDTSIAPVSLKIQAQRCDKQKHFSMIINRDVQKSSLDHGATKNIWQKSNFKLIIYYVLIFLQKVAIVATDLIVIHCSRLFPDCWRSYRESTFASL